MEPLPSQQSQPGRLRFWLSQVLALVAIAWLVMVPLLLVMLYQYAWQMGRYPKPGAPISPLHGPWTYDPFLEEGTHALLNPPIYAFVFSVASLGIKPNNRATVTLVLSVILFIVAFGYIGMVED